ncbi:YbaB/EbfC family nucleoid-associated protein [Kitasatospora sp. NPDC049285]|uniref:YbaB/EbfC family nucleoid-associated protein n=1 Tax=Kitasatospora sp. NPDC049285 TaxID=3157096 RepID=UPI003418C8BF
MNLDVEGRIEAAMAVMREQQQKMAAAKAELDKVTTTVTSKDRLVSVTVGPQGQVTSIKFLNTAYQSMAPAELSAALVTVLNEARGRMGEKVTRRISQFSNVGQLVQAAAGFGDDLPADLEELMKPLRAMRPGFEAEEAEAKRTKQEQFEAEERAAAKKAAAEKQAEFKQDEPKRRRKSAQKQEEFSG